MQIIEVHPNGSYRIGFDLAPESIDALLSCLGENDGMSAW